VRLTIQIKGLKELERGLQDLKKATRRNAIRRALMKSIEPMAEDARQRAPVDKGKLQKSIIVGTKVKVSQSTGGLEKIMTDQGIRTTGGNFEMTPDGWRRRSAGAIIVYMGPTSSIAHFQELGTAHHAAQPFMRPAFEANKEAVLNDFQKWLEVEVEKARKRAARKAARIAAKALR
jgi:HK97 gp10 family phage protein